MAYGYDYDFVVDEEKLEDVGTTMTGKADEIRSKIAELYNIIDVDLSQSWQSSAYDMFKDACHNYEQGLYEIANMIEMFGNSARDFGEAADTLLTNINSKF